MGVSVGVSGGKKSSRAELGPVALEAPEADGAARERVEQRVEKAGFPGRRLGVEDEGGEAPVPVSGGRAAWLSAERLVERAAGCRVRRETRHRPLEDDPADGGRAQLRERARGGEVRAVQAELLQRTREGRRGRRERRRRLCREKRLGDGDGLEVRKGADAVRGQEDVVGCVLGVYPEVPG